MALGDKINEIRKDRKISIDELCERSGIPKGTLSKITAGITANPTLETVRAISKALGCSLDDLDDTSVKKKKAPPYSEEAKKIANAYDNELDKWGKQAVRELVETEVRRCKDEAQLKESSTKEEPKVIPLYRTPAAAGKDIPVPPAPDAAEKQRTELEKEADAFAAMAREQFLSEKLRETQAPSANEFDAG